jgi:CelD/BcsL family acetyltransferase involved in cellulose biosynthesis
MIGALVRAARVRRDHAADQGARLMPVAVAHATRRGLAGPRDEGSITGAASCAAAECALELVTSRAEFDALETEWNALFERAGRGAQMFQTFGWLWHWCNHYLGAPEDPHGARLAIVTGRREGRLAMVWPLVRERRGGVLKVSWMGEPVSQYGDVLVEDGAHAGTLLRAGWHFVATRLDADIIQLRKVRADSALAPVLAEAGASQTGKLGAPSLDLASAPTFADYEQRYSSGARRNRRRQRRRLAERGALMLEVQTGGPEAQRLAAVALRLKRAWLEERALFSPAFADTRIERFFADVAGAATHAAGCSVLALKCADVPAALEIGIRCKDRSAIHVIAYDRRFEKMAAGALLLEDSIRRAREAGVRTYDLLAPADPYKLEWADQVTEVCDWTVPLTLAGRLYSRVYLTLLRGNAKRVIAALPAPVRRLVARGVFAALSASGVSEKAE